MQLHIFVNEFHKKNMWQKDYGYKKKVRIQASDI